MKGQERRGAGRELLLGPEQLMSIFSLLLTPLQGGKVVPRFYYQGSGAARG